MITFDCIFVIDLKTASSGLTGQRYDATQGEIFWERGDYTLFNIYRDGSLHASNDGNSFYEATLSD